MIQAGTIVWAGPALGPEKIRPWLVVEVMGRLAVLVMLTSTCNRDTFEIHADCLPKVSYPAFDKCRVVPIDLVILFSVAGLVDLQLVERVIDGACESLETPEDVIQALTEAS